MKVLSNLVFAFGFIALTASSGAEARVKVERVEYHGWHGAYRMSNGSVELVVVPQIGRIMRYGVVGGPNMLWENPDVRGTVSDPIKPTADWINYGGDKLWNAPQEKWDWPPDPALDRGTYTVTPRPGGRLLLTGQASAKSGLQFQREITLAAQGTGVTIRNTLANVGAKPANWAIWEVAQIDDPTEVRLPRSRSGRFAPGYHLFKTYSLLPGMVTVSGDAVSLRRNAKQAAKIGSDAPAGWIAGVVAGQEFRITAAREPGKAYADEGCNQEIFVSADPTKYAEMEMLGALHELRPGGSTAFVTHWSLSRTGNK
jgi:hypothetical protein